MLTNVFVCVRAWHVCVSVCVCLLIFVQRDITYIPSHLYHIVFELLKNSCRAVTELYDDTTTIDLPPVEVLIVKGDTDLTIRISDQGGGIPKANQDEIFAYYYSTASRPESFEVFPYGVVDCFLSEPRVVGWRCRGVSAVHPNHQWVHIAYCQLVPKVEAMVGPKVAPTSSVCCGRYTDAAMGSLPTARSARRMCSDPDRHEQCTAGRIWLWASHLPSLRQVFRGRFEHQLGRGLWHRRLRAFARQRVRCHRSAARSNQTRVELHGTAEPTATAALVGWTSTRYVAVECPRLETRTSTKFCVALWPDKIL
eukprot:m.593676 g.593676  ORF g.593676 m.593676 type:complete len:310 (-) comp22393_c0_seq38:22-951(-)